MKLRSFILVAIAAAMLTACGSRPASDLYVLRVPENTPDSCTKPRSLLIERPSAPNEYDSKRIAVMLNNNHLNYYTGASWASPFPDQLQGFLSDAFTRQGINVVDNTTANADHATTLRITIREAHITDLSSPIVHLRLTGTVSNSSGHSTRFKVNEAIPAAENHMSQIIDAYDQAALNAAETITQSMKLRCAGIPAGD